ncbi:flavodoxin domain-containing protein [Metaplanococcus flavidus]|uniref:Flavodoxin domain-containing protein n=1 Tax=Metaplanococcus flavidus TaxID=569883 RepID=A0ABW3LE30_9BACL
MASMSCEPEIAIVYSSVTGNTAELAGMLMECAQERWKNVRVFGPREFCREKITDFDAVMVGTYTWGSGEIPHDMRKVYRHFEASECKNVVTAVFGTGDSFFAEFCGGVDRFRDMLFVQTQLAAVLKVELSPEEREQSRCEKLIMAVGKKLPAEKVTVTHTI